MECLKSGIYHHYKSKEKLYKVIGVAKHTETMEDMVVYQALYSIPEFDGEGVLFVRPLSMFLENVMIDGKEISRFTYIGESFE